MNLVKHHDTTKYLLHTRKVRGRGGGIKGRECEGDGPGEVGDVGLKDQSSLRHKQKIEVMECVPKPV